MVVQVDGKFAEQVQSSMAMLGVATREYEANKQDDQAKRQWQRALMDAYRTAGRAKVRRRDRDPRRPSWCATAGARAVAPHARHACARSLPLSLLQAAAAVELVVSLLERDAAAKVLLFAHHKDVLDPCEQLLRRRGSSASGGGGAGEQPTWRVARIDGQTSAAQRVDAVDAFQSEPDVRVLVLGMTAAGVGLNLTAASACIFAELHFNLSVLMQCEDRAHRIGQTRQVRSRGEGWRARTPCGGVCRRCTDAAPRVWLVAQVEVFYCTASGTADDLVWPSILAKSKVQGQVLAGSSASLPMSGAAATQRHPAVLQASQAF